MSTVKVTAKDGKVVIANANNSEYGYIRVESVDISINSDGWAQKSKRSALLKGKVELLNEFGYKEGQILPGKIVVEETTKEPYAGAQPKINPSTGEIMKSLEGQPIFRESFYTTDNNRQDVLVPMKKTISTSISAGA